MHFTQHTAFILSTTGLLLLGSALIPTSSVYGQGTPAAQEEEDKNALSPQEKNLVGKIKPKASGNEVRQVLASPTYTQAPPARQQAMLSTMERTLATQGSQRARAAVSEAHTQILAKRVLEKPATVSSPVPSSQRPKGTPQPANTSANPLSTAGFLGLTKAVPGFSPKSAAPGAIATPGISSASTLFPTIPPTTTGTAPGGLPVVPSSAIPAPGSSPAGMVSTTTPVATPPVIPPAAGPGASFSAASPAVSSPAPLVINENTTAREVLDFTLADKNHMSLRAKAYLEAKFGGVVKGANNTPFIEQAYKDAAKDIPSLNNLSPQDRIEIYWTLTALTNNVKAAYDAKAKVGRGKEVPVYAGITNGLFSGKTQLVKGVESLRKAMDIHFPGDDVDFSHLSLSEAAHEANPQITIDAKTFIEEFAKAASATLNAKSWTSAGALHESTLFTEARGYGALTDPSIKINYQGKDISFGDLPAHTQQEVVTRLTQKALKFGVNASAELRKAVTQVQEKALATAKTHLQATHEITAPDPHTPAAEPKDIPSLAVARMPQGNDLQKSFFATVPIEDTTFQGKSVGAI